MVDFSIFELILVIRTQRLREANGIWLGDGKRLAQLWTSLFDFFKLILSVERNFVQVYCSQERVKVYIHFERWTVGKILIELKEKIEKFILRYPVDGTKIFTTLRSFSTISTNQPMCTLTVLPAIPITFKCFRWAINASQNDGSTVYLTLYFWQMSIMIGAISG